MFKKNRWLLLVYGLMILFILGNHVFAQEIQSQCNDACTNQIVAMNGDQIKSLFGSDKPDENFR